MPKCIYVLFLLQLILETKSYEVKVRVKQGTLIGKMSITILNKAPYYAFHRVPYAQPPIRNLRFKEPLAPTKWDRPYNASVEFYGACAQAHIVHTKGTYGIEDCLYLNIFTPNLRKHLKSKLPIIVWVHGYAFTSSFSHIHGGDFFIEENVIFITLTHRIGAFGFLKITESDTNMGLKDIVMALKWIKTNIVQFGGDKSKVTVMGSGSGATFLSLLLMTKAHELFSKIILHSASMFHVVTRIDSDILEKNILLDKLIEKGIINFKTAPTRDIIALSQKIYNHNDSASSQRTLIPFMPIIERNTNKSLLTKTPKQYVDNINYIDKPMLIGFNSQESIAEVIPFLHNPQYLKYFQDNFKFIVPFSEGCNHNISTKVYRTVADLIKLKYFDTGISLENFLRYTADLYKYPVITFIKAMLKVKGNKMYVYKFNYSGQFNIFKATSVAGANVDIKGASHGDEICYLMKCEPLLDIYLKARGDKNNTDILFIKQIVNMWANFVKTGAPTTKIDRRNVRWPQMTLKDENMLLLDKELKIVSTSLENDMFTFWNQMYEKYYSPNHCSNNKHVEL